MRSTTLHDLLAWIVDVVIPAVPTYIVVRISTTEITAQHNGGAPVDAHAIEIIRAACYTLGAIACHQVVPGQYRWLGAGAGHAPRMRLLSLSEAPAYTHFTWAIASAGPGAIRIADTLAALYHLSWDTGMIVEVYPDANDPDTRARFDTHIPPPELQIRQRARGWHGGLNTIGAASCEDADVLVMATAHFLGADVPDAKLHIFQRYNRMPLPVAQQTAWATKLIASLDLHGSDLHVGECTLPGVEADWSGSLPHALAALMLPLASAATGVIYVTLVVLPSHGPITVRSWDTLEVQPLAVASATLVGALRQLREKVEATQALLTPAGSGPEGEESDTSDMLLEPELAISLEPGQDDA
mmetsp:Transcript_27561/g.64633  ORF Transcript_27561/g.64633 Transcript_27561/m.64633 type:complete len:356 (-) Transcript_27561:90-1157(-)